MNWESASAPPGSHARPPSDRDVAWRAVSLPVRGDDSEDHWFRTRVSATRETTLRFSGLATVCDVFIDRELVLQSESMFLEHELPIDSGEHEVFVCAHALTPLLRIARKPRPRWRSRVPVDGNLRWFRTSLLGRAPGFSPGPPLVGPWRSVTLVDPADPRVDVRSAFDGRDGLVTVRCAESLGELDVTVGGVTERLSAGGGTIRVAAPELWWPHTHGEPLLHEVRVQADGAEVRRNVGFRSLTHSANLEHEGLDLHVNGVAVFARGAVWTPTGAGDAYATLKRARDAGLNMIRVVGTMVYEDATFHDACDELGLLVWQDLMFANMDYPFGDETFASMVDMEVRQALNEVAGRPSLAVVCGNSEIEQQVAMLGLPPELGRSQFFTSTLPDIMTSLGIDAAYLPSAPTGGTFPFRTDRGVANYFGVGAYLRDVADVRRACVRFASECLAFANVPDEAPVDRSAGVMRDVGADWDFADVRDHYLHMLHGVTPDDADYWEQARVVTGELMALVFGEWRRAKSSCTGAIVLWLRDLVPGAGWGLLDSDGRPKAAWHHLRRAVAPTALWFVDEGLNGLALHMANDAADSVRATLRVALYRDEHLLVGEVETEVLLEPHSVVECDTEELLGRFVDIGYAYRFGELQQDVVVATLHHEGNELSKAFFSPIRDGRRRRERAEALGLCASATVRTDGVIGVQITAARLVHGVRIRMPGFEADDDSFALEPARERTVALRSCGADAAARTLRVTALNLDGELEVSVA